MTVNQLSLFNEIDEFFLLPLDLNAGNDQMYQHHLGQWYEGIH
jgi:hypothetical protein